MNEIQALIDFALGEVGYLEKKTNAKLYDKTANAGNNNYTKYGLEQGCNGQPYCDAFVDYCFSHTFGAERAKTMLNGFSNYTPTSANYFKKMNRWFTEPKVGDQIFFQNDVRINHTGIVYQVANGKVYTIEGNTNSQDNSVNGNGVFAKHYDLTNKRIAGYGRPLYKETMQKMKFGIDISDNQGLIDWQKVKNAGVQFVIMRSTRGSGKPDNYLQTNIKACHDFMIPFDFYKYSYAMNEREARNEALTVCEILKDYGIIPNGKTRIWLDMEYDKQLALGKDACHAIMEAFKDEVLKAGFSYGLYMGKYAYENKINASILDDDVWIARYPDTSSKKLTQVPSDNYKPVAKGGSKLYGWQFSSKGKVDGINGYVDLDCAYFDIEEKEIFPEYYSKPEWTLIESLNKIGVDSSYNNRKRIAQKNGIANYSGKKEENLSLLEKLIKGELIKL